MMRETPSAASPALIGVDGEATVEPVDQPSEITNFGLCAGQRRALPAAGIARPACEGAALPDTGQQHPTLRLELCSEIRSLLGVGDSGGFDVRNGHGHNISTSRQ
jgi:hypothetical protein